jgi:hypothetical protein
VPKKYLFLRKCLANLILLPTQCKKWHFDEHFNDIILKVWPQRHPTALILLGFTAISDHTRAGEVPTGCGL